MGKIKAHNTHIAKTGLKLSQLESLFTRKRKKHLDEAFNKILQFVRAESYRKVQRIIQGFKVLKAVTHANQKANQAHSLNQLQKNSQSFEFTLNLRKNEMENRRLAKSTILLASILNRIYQTNVKEFLQRLSFNKQKQLNKEEVLNKLRAVFMMMRWNKRYLKNRKQYRFVKLRQYAQYLKRLEEMEKNKTRVNPWF